MWSSETYPDLPIRSGKRILFGGTLKDLLGNGYRDYRRAGMTGVFSPAFGQTYYIYQGQYIPITLVRYREPEYFATLPLIEIADKKRYVAELIWRMDSAEREKILASPLLSRFVRRWDIRDMSQLVGDKEKTWELQLLLNPDDEDETAEIFNSVEIYRDMNYSKWRIGAY